MEKEFIKLISKIIIKKSIINTINIQNLQIINILSYILFVNVLLMYF